MNIVGYHISPDLIATSASKIRREPPWLDFLFEGEGETIKVAYHLDYFVANLLRMMEIPEPQLRELNEKGELRFRGYRFKYIPKKFLSIAHGSQFAVFSDMAQYMDNWRLHSEYDEKPEDLALRKAHIAQQIGIEVYDALVKLGLHPKSLVSPISAFEKEILSKMDLPVLKDVPVEASDYAYNCTHGPWVEALQKGHFRETEDWDIKSAYPAMLSQLIDVRKGNWVKSEKYEPTAYYGYAKGMVNITADFSPIVYSKTEEQNFTPKGRWETYLTKEEIDFINEYKLGNFELYEGWWFFPDEIVRPLEGLMNWLYSKKEGTKGLVKKVLKRVMAGIWGYTLSVNYDGELGDYFNSVWGVEVESRTRLEVARFVLDNNLLDNLLSIAVDGVLVSKENRQDAN